jgi:hypothetical protein
MKAIETKVQVNADHMLTVQLPVDVQMGEYDAVLVLNSSSEQSVQESDHSEDEQEDKTVALRWKKFFKEVDQLPILENREEGDFQQHLVEKYRKQGLEL